MASSIACPRCGADVASADVNVQSMVAKCGSCGNVFRFDDQLAAPASPVAPAPEPARVPRPRAWVDVTPAADPNALPPSLDYRDSAKETVGDLVLTRRWFGPQALFIAFFAVFWNGFLVVWYGIAFSQDDTPLMMVLFPVIHVAVGVGLAYYVLASFLNRTTLEATATGLKVDKGPLPWPGGKKAFDATSVRRFYALTGRTTRNGRALAELAVDLGGTKHALLRGLHSRDEAAWLAQRLADHYGVPFET